MKAIILILLFYITLQAQSFTLIGLMDSGYEPETLAYQARVLADGGMVTDLTTVNNFYKNAKSNAYLDTLAFAWIMEGGIKKDANNKTTVVYDLTTNNRDLAQADTSKSPSYSATTGLNFDGTDDYVVKTFTENQPTTFMMVLNPIAWQNGDRYIGGGTANGAEIFQNTSTPNYTAAAITLLNNNANLSIGNYGLITVVFNGANSSNQVNNTTAVTGDAGTNNSGGVVIGAKATPSNYGKIAVKSLLIFNNALSSTKQTIAKNILNSLYSVY